MKTFADSAELFERRSGNRFLKSNTTNLEAVYLVLTKREQLNLPS